MNKKEIIEEVVVSDSASTRTSTMTNNALSAAGAGGGGSAQSPNPSVVIVPEKRKRYSTQEKLELVRLTYLPGNTVSSVARAHGIAPSVLFRWRALDKQGSLTAIQTGEGTVSAKKYEAALEGLKDFKDFSDRLQPIMLYSKTRLSTCSQKNGLRVSHD